MVLDNSVWVIRLHTLDSILSDFKSDSEKFSLNLTLGNNWTVEYLPPNSTSAGNGKVWRRWCCTAVSYFWPSPPLLLKLTFHIGWQANLQCILFAVISTLSTSVHTKHHPSQDILFTCDALSDSIYLQLNELEHINLLSQTISNLHFMLLSTSQTV